MYFFPFTKSEKRRVAQVLFGRGVVPMAGEKEVGKW
jgi:hypothetical protein